MGAIIPILGDNSGVLCQNSPSYSGGFRLKFRALLASTAIFAGLTGSAAAQSLSPSPPLLRTTYGDVGLFDMPSARMAPDGQLSFTASALSISERFTLSFQATPWLEGSFRYARVGHWGDDAHYYDRSFGVKVRLLQEYGLLPSVSVGSRDFVGSGGYGSEYVVASKQVGDFDFTAGLGWGRLADTQAIANPLGELVSSFNDRSAPNNRPAGELGFNSLFHGSKAGAFGGLTWRTPIEGLTLIGEYSSDKYVGERSAGGLKVRSPTNVGLAYRPADSLMISAGWMYGTTYGLTIAISSDPTQNYPSAVRIGPAPTEPVIRTESERQAALSALQRRSSGAEAAKNGGVWVSVPAPRAQIRNELLQNFRSGSSDIRDITLEGQSLLIDARLHSDTHEQCNRYARIAAASSANIRWLAISDLQNTTGQTVMCSTEINRTQFASAVSVGQSLAAKDADTAAGLREALAEQDITFEMVKPAESEWIIYYENNRYNRSTEAAGRVTRVLMAKAPAQIEIFRLIETRLGMPVREYRILRSAMERGLSDVSGQFLAQEAVKLRLPSMETTPLITQDFVNYPTLSFTLDPKLTQHVFDPAAPIQFLVYGDATGLLQIAPGLAIEAEATATLWTNYTFTRDPGSDLPHVRTDILQYLDHGKYGIAALAAVYRARLTPTVFTQVRAGMLEDMYTGGGLEMVWRPEESRFVLTGDIYKVWQRDYQRLFNLRNYSVVTGHVALHYNSPWYGMHFAVRAGQYLAGDRGVTFEMSRRFASGIEVGAWATFTNVPYAKFGEGSFDKGIMIHIPFEWGLPIWSQSSYNLWLSPLTRDGGQRLGGDDSLYEATERTSYGTISEHIDDVTNP
ncbi:hypothetical protein FHS83_000215 [Rhizomicrobium palustre]|uniref:YjbH domain-containing protein n=1 Tax=Rhizomicrobium palustre TaxID=189966 RepID=A0A846MV58_9PROT|nr:YjbH domain-containing protein [Rhizomicrobium palustre]NIK86897.1 hypothetical protein [Rhizomicrobium palustre]